MVKAMTKPKELDFLTDEFFVAATETFRKKSSGYKWKDMSHDTALHMPDGTYYHFQLSPCPTNCGTLEVRHLDEEDKVSLNMLVESMMNNIIHQSQAHFLYFAPREEEYDYARDLLNKAGFKVIGEFQHVGYDWRDDQGMTDIYQFALTADQRLTLMGHFKTDEYDYADEDYDD